MRFPLPRRTALLLLLSVLPAAAQPQQLTVFAAASLTEAFRDALPRSSIC